MTAKKPRISRKATGGGASSLQPFDADPNTWEFPQHEFRIYGDDRAQVYAIVDEEDYHFLIRWLWSTKLSRGGRKTYLFRSAYNGGPNLRKSVFLHVVIMQRTGLTPPSTKHSIV